jgi:type I restriction enzyme R subunit
MKEATSRIKINKLLEAAGWRFFPDGKGPANIQLEPSVTIKTADLDAIDQPGVFVPPTMLVLSSQAG